MEIVVIFFIIIICALIFKSWDNTLICFGLIDIFLRIVNFIGNNTIKEIRAITNKYFPNSIESMIRANSSGTLEKVLVWIYVILMIVFWVLVLRMLINRLKYRH